MSTYVLTVNSQDYKLTVNSQDYKLALSRTGGQGSKGNSITNAEVNSNNDLLITISDSAGDVVEIINAGKVTQAFNVNALTDVTITSVQDNDIIQYDSATSKFVNHSLTTSKVADIDNTGLTDGALYVYDGVANKHIATTEINNANTTITGGTF
jgi:hypothetical protein